MSIFWQTQANRTFIDNLGLDHFSNNNIDLPIYCPGPITTGTSFLDKVEIVNINFNFKFLL